MYEKLCPMSFGNPVQSRQEMNCLGVTCAWYDEKAGKCIVRVAVEAKAAEVKAAAKAAKSGKNGETA